MTEFECIDAMLSTMADTLNKLTGDEVLLSPPRGGMVRRVRPVIALSLQGSEDDSVGFNEYMGIYTDSDGRELERYARRMSLTVGADIYSPKDMENGAPVCSQVFSRLIMATCAFPSYMKAGRVSCGSIKFDGQTGMFTMPVRIKMSLCLYADRADEGAALSFKLRGELVS